MKLSDFDHFRNDERVRFRQELVNGETVTIVCYAIADKEFWTLPLATECRGIVFDSNGDCISRPFNKFFNVGEREDTLVQNLPELTEVLEKRDGSMIVPVLVGGKVAWKTKKSFYSDVAVEASLNVTDEMSDFVNEMLGLDMTPIFEYTSPNNRIVLDYGDRPEFVLLSIRHNQDGTYTPHPFLKDAQYTWNIKVIEKHDLTLQDCIEQSKTLENFEGWVLCNPATGFYVKQKTDWYLRQHRVNTDLRERDVADMVIEETIDDCKSAVTAAGLSLQPVEDIETSVVSDLVDLRTEVERLVSCLIDKKDFKAAAAFYKNHPYFGMIMAELRGKEPDYKRHWKDHMRTKYSLKTIYGDFRK